MSDKRSTAPRSGTDRGRRHLLRGIAAAICGFAWPAGRALAERAYPKTVAALRHAFQRESLASRRYREFAQQAKVDGYRGIAYLFLAFSASEMIHSHNFQRLLARLGVEVEADPLPALPPATTKENLIRAVGDEVDSIEALYPNTLAALKPEGHPDAIAYVGYAWESEKQHRDSIRRIQRYSPSFFDAVARTIDEKTSTYFVCQICGSTLNEVPASQCPVCGNPSTHYRRIEPPA